MMRALLWKELRGGWLCALPFALLMGATVVSVLFDSRDPLLAKLDLFPRANAYSWRILMDNDLLTYVGFSTIGLGLFLGLWQTIPENLAGTAPLFVHVARSRARILTAKIAVALALIMGIVIVPVGLIVGGLIASGGPREWGSLSAIFLLLSAGLAYYFGAMAVGVRGPPWKDWVPKAAGVALIGASVFFRLDPWDSVPFPHLMAGGAIVSAVWAVTGNATREF